jgi:hypothetical protein
VLRGLFDLDGISFVAKIAVEPSRNAAYRDQNRLAHVVLPTAPEWQKVMNGETVPAAPAAKPRTGIPQAEKPAWGQGSAAGSATPSARPAWSSAMGGGAPAAQPAQAPAATPAPAPAVPARAAPAWLTS